MLDIKYEYTKNRFDSDVKVWRAFVTNGVCDEIELLIRHRSGFKKTVSSEKRSEETPLTIEYFCNRELRIAVLGNTELLLDTIVHYYLLNRDTLFVVRIETPHVGQLKDQFGESISPEESLPVYYGFLFIKGKLKSGYSEQGSLHPKIPPSKIKDVLSAYQNFVLPKVNRLKGGA